LFILERTRAPARFPVLEGPIRRQTVRAKQAGHFPLFNCPTLTPHSSNHKDESKTHAATIFLNIKKYFQKSFQKVISKIVR
jgi:hypothetical protein